MSKSFKFRAGSHSVGVVLVGMIAGLVYLNTLTHGFVWDDQTYVLGNSQFKRGEKLLHYFVSDFCEGVNEHCYFYRPLVSITYLLDHALWGGEPFGYHLSNVIWHIGVSLIVYEMGWYLFGSLMAALIGAGFFAVHPIHVESVAFVAGRTDPPATFFYLLAFILYIRSVREERGYFFRIFSLFCFVLALMSKEVAVTLPLVVMVYSLLYPNPVIRWLELWPRLRPSILYGVVAVGYLLMRRLILGQSFSSDSIQEGLGDRLITFPLLLMENLRYLVIPWPLQVLRDTAEGRGIGDSYVVGAILVVGIGVGVAIRYGRKYREGLFGVSWMVITLLPVLNLLPVPWPTVWDRFLYLPSVGLCLIMGWLGVRILEGVRNKKGDIYRWVGIVGGAGLFLLFMEMTVDRNQDWRDNVTLWGVTVQQIPFGERMGEKARDNLAIAHYNYGVALAEAGRTEEASIQYQKTIVLNSRFVNSYLNLARIHEGEGREEEALRLYEEAVRIDPGSAQAHYNLGTLYLKKGRLELARGELEAAVRLDPDHSKAHNNLGFAHQSAGEMRLALEEFREAVRSDPGNAEAHQNLGIALKQQGDYQEAEGELLRALDLNPKLWEVHRSLGFFYLEGIQEQEKALYHLRAVQALRPGPDRELEEALVKLNRISE